jgi:hypothetical protein
MSFEKRFRSVRRNPLAASPPSQKRSFLREMLELYSFPTVQDRFLNVYLFVSVKASLR